ncbi:MAG: glycosyltransferase family 4 protein [Rudaea sp.]
MQYILDGRYIQDHFPGIGRYVYNLACAMPRLAPSDRFRILVNPRLANSRYDLRTLLQNPNVDLVEVGAGTASAQEQLLARARNVVSGAALWHSAYYIMPYFLPVPAVVTLEDLTPLVLPEEMPNPGKRLLYRMLNLLAARRASHIITISEAAARDLVRVLGVARNKLSVIPLAAGPQFRPAEPAAVSEVRERLGLPSRYALYVGSNKPHKNLPRLVQAWARVDSSVLFVIAGHWDSRYPLGAAAERLTTEGRLRLIPSIAAGDLPALMTGAAFFVFPSLHEGFGLPPLEAMACGTTVAC